MATEVSVRITRAFVAMRRVLASMAPILARIEANERRQIADQAKNDANQVRNEERFKQIVLAPDIAGLDWVKARHECPYGTIRSEWRKEGGKFKWTVEVPPNTTAKVFLPVGLESTAVPADAKKISHGNNRPVWRVGCGTWSFEAECREAK